MQTGSGPIATDSFWTMSLTTHVWSNVVTSSVMSKHSFPTDIIDYTRWDPNDSSDASTQTTVFNPMVKPPARQQSAAAMIGPMAGLSTPFLMVGGLGAEGHPLDDIWLIDTQEANPTQGARDGVLCFDGIDDVISIPLPSFVSTTRSMNGVWIDFWIKLESGDSNNVILWDTMTADAVVLRTVLTTIDAQPYVRLIFYPGDNKQQVIKTWGPITTKGFSTSWHHFAFVLRFAHISRGSSVEPDAIPTQAFFFVDCQSVSDDGLFLQLSLKSLALSSGFTSVFVGGASSRASQMARNSYSNFNGFMDNIRIWWVQCPQGPSACNPYAFLYPIQDYSPYQRVPASGIQDYEVSIDHVAPVLRESMFTDRMSTNATDLLVNVEVDHQDMGGILIDSSTWLPEDCSTGKSGRTACATCPEECFFDDCAAFDVDCIGARLSEENVKMYAENGTCECSDTMTCPIYTEHCKCPRGFQRTCTKNNAASECIEWGCACGARLSSECAVCILNSNRQTPADPCLAPGSCRKSSCEFPFLKKFDEKHTSAADSTTIIEANLQLETIELQKFATDMVGRYLDGRMYEETKRYVLEVMEQGCYAYHWSRFGTFDYTTKDDDKRCKDPKKYNDEDVFGYNPETSLSDQKCQCIFEGDTVSDKNSHRNMVVAFFLCANRLARLV